MVPLTALFVTAAPAGSDDPLKKQVDVWFWVYFAASMVKATYSYIWDIYMDWGLLRNFEEGPKKYLRDKINYHPYFYFWASFWDFILRYIWILFLFNLGDSTSIFMEM